MHYQLLSQTPRLHKPSPMSIIRCGVVGISLGYDHLIDLLMDKKEDQEKIFAFDCFLEKY